MVHACDQRKVLVMRNAETILAIIRERGKKGLDLEDVYRQLYNPDLYLRRTGESIETPVR